MIWARVAIAGGLLAIAAGFGFGVEWSSSTSVGGQVHRCDSAIPVSWLAPGAEDPPPVPRTRLERRVAVRCSDVVGRERLVMWGVLGVGALAGLVGWTALRESAQPERFLVPAR